MALILFKIKNLVIIFFPGYWSSLFWSLFSLLAGSLKFFENCDSRKVLPANYYRGLFGQQAVNVISQPCGQWIIRSARISSTPAKVALSGNLEGKDYGLKASIDGRVKRSLRNASPCILAGVKRASARTIYCLPRPSRTFVQFIVQR